MITDKWCVGGRLHSETVNKAKYECLDLKIKKKLFQLLKEPTFYIVDINNKIIYQT